MTVIFVALCLLFGGASVAAQSSSSTTSTATQPTEPTSSGSTPMKFKLVNPTTVSGWAWDVNLITLTDDRGNMLPVTNTFDSAHCSAARYHHSQAFTNKNTLWGGRKKNGVFEIGGETQYPTGKSLTVDVIQGGRTHAVTEAIENQLKSEGTGVKFMVEKNESWEERCILTLKEGTTLSCVINIS